MSPAPALRLAGWASVRAGFAALLTQLAWIRALILVVGGSVYAFTITLASFPGTGFGLGSLVYTRFLARPRKGGWQTVVAKGAHRAGGLAVPY